ncbi:MAG: hypothetical protein WBX25_35475 [Rhodomicrobium sp.]
MPAGFLLWRGRPLIGFASRQHVKRFAIGSFIVIVCFYAVIKCAYVDIDALVFKEMPSIDESLAVSSGLGVSLSFLFLLHLLRQSSPSLLRSLHLEYRLTRDYLEIVTKDGSQRFGCDRFAALTMSFSVQGSPADIRLEVAGDGEITPTKITLYSVQDPIRVAGLIRTTLAPHTLAKDIQGNLAHLAPAKQKAGLHGKKGATERVWRLFVYFIAIVIMFLAIVQLSFFDNAHNWWGMRDYQGYKIIAVICIAGITLIQLFRWGRAIIRLVRWLFTRTSAEARK